MESANADRCLGSQSAQADFVTFQPRFQPPGVISAVAPPSLPFLHRLRPIRLRLASPPSTDRNVRSPAPAASIQAP
jgi:hypothetical protein